MHPGDNANIVQHPEGGYKKVTIQENEVLQDTGVIIHYASDTLGGSSGAPVFNNRWEVIALHHASKKADGLTLPDRATPPDFVNEGIKISAIAADIEARVEAGGGVSASRSVLKIFGGVDSLMGFFGALGRHPEPAAAPKPAVPPPTRPHQPPAQPPEASTAPQAPEGRRRAGPRYLQQRRSGRRPRLLERRVVYAVFPR